MSDENKVINFLPSQKYTDSEVNSAILSAGRALLNGDTSSIVGNRLSLDVYNAMKAAGLGGGGGGVGTVVPTFVTGQTITLKPGKPANFTLVPRGNNVYEIDVSLPQGEKGEPPHFIPGNVNTIESGNATFDVREIDPETNTYAIDADIPKGEKGDTPIFISGTTIILPPNTPPALRVTEESGGTNTYKIDADIPKGADGISPQITIGTVTTLTEGSNAEARVTENPSGSGTFVVDLDIPRGNTGFCPTANIVQNSSGDTVITITDVNGPTVVTLHDSTIALNAEINQLKTKIQALTDYLKNHQPGFKVQDIAERDALTVANDNVKETSICLVKDATGDPTVKSGGAIYMPNIDAATEAITWEKVGEIESLDVITYWENIQNRPESLVSNIDDAVAKKHSHSNSVVLDNIAEDPTSGLLRYKGHELYETELEAENAYVLNTEDVIGIWIDGKPIHRRTYQFNLSNANTDNIIDLSSINCEQLVRIYGIKRDERSSSKGAMVINSPISDLSVYKPINSNYLVWESNSAQNTNTICEITIEYTKTTDSVVGPYPFDPVSVFESALL